mmetsp:Transcript_339/g.797  ORF Transcript_339/g.797 Transcript_339/m.797 type:complete len:131 (+) Transcript_339:76-468(+)
MKCCHPNCICILAVCMEAWSSLVLQIISKMLCPHKYESIHISCVEMKTCQRNHIKIEDTAIHDSTGHESKSLSVPPLYTASCEVFHGRSRMKKTVRKKNMSFAQWADQFFAEIGLDPESQDKTESDTLSP